ncbi:hypothetical protein BDZ45DRAFT_694406 [Acephala macrosclerotiorum]|nr:hypothetical protein BDZ45DRAFT_694406 [Acephala macrosclerotiorum]
MFCHFLSLNSRIVLSFVLTRPSFDEEPAAAKSGTEEPKVQADGESKSLEPSGVQVKKEPMLEINGEVRLKPEGISGEGGGADVEYEDGKAAGLKRGVKENMFR